MAHKQIDHLQNPLHYSSWTGNAFYNEISKRNLMGTMTETLHSGGAGLHHILPVWYNKHHLGMPEDEKYLGAGMNSSCGDALCGRVYVLCGKQNLQQHDDVALVQLYDVRLDYVLHLVKQHTYWSDDLH